MIKNPFKTTEDIPIDFEYNSEDMYLNKHESYYKRPYLHGVYVLRIKIRPLSNK